MAPCQEEVLNFGDWRIVVVASSRWLTLIIDYFAPHDVAVVIPNYISEASLMGKLH